MAMSRATKKKYIERVSNNLAYISREINTNIAKLKEEYEEIRIFCSYKGEEGSQAVFTPIRPEDVVFHFTREELDAKIAIMKERMNYIMQCKAELLRLTDKHPIDEDTYDAAYIEDFKSRVANLEPEQFDKELQAVPEGVREVSAIITDIDKDGNVTLGRPNGAPPAPPYGSDTVDLQEAGLPVPGGEDWDDDVQLTPNWNLKEFAVTYKGKHYKVPQQYVKYAKGVAERLEKAAPLIGVPKVLQNSLYRPPVFEMSLKGGDKYGLHQYAAGVDLRVGQGGKTNMQLWNIAGQVGFTSLIDEGNHVHADIRSQCVDNPKGGPGRTFYARLVGGSYQQIPAPNGATEGDPIEGGGVTDSSATGGNGYKIITYNIFEDDYFGPKEVPNFVTSTSDPEINKVTVPSGVESWTQMASLLGTTASQLQAMNAGTSDLFPGINIYIPASSISQARQLSTEAHNNVAALTQRVEQISNQYTATLRAAPPPAPPPPSTGLATLPPAAPPTSDPNAKSESTPFQSYAGNKGFIRMFDMEPYRDGQKTCISIEYDGKVRVLETVVGPIQTSEAYSNAIGTHQTNAGWFVSRHGENPTSVSISGIMLNTNGVAEKHAFVEEWKAFLTDQVDSKTGDYYNNAVVKLTVEGTQYQGWVTSLTFNKSADRENYYNFSLSFISVFYKNTRSVSNSLMVLKGSMMNNETTSDYLGQGLARALNLK